MARLVQSITDLIGDTPLVRLNRVVPEGSAEIYVKLSTRIQVQVLKTVLRSA